VLNSELAEAVGERDRLRADVVDCENRIQYLDEVVKAKEQERDHLMINYRKLIAEHEKMDVSLKLSSEESNNMK
jgi:hypothetical protein